VLASSHFRRLLMHWCLMISVLTDHAVAVLLNVAECRTLNVITNTRSDAILGRLPEGMLPTHMPSSAAVTCSMALSYSYLRKPHSLCVSLGLLLQWCFLLEIRAQLRMLLSSFRPRSTVSVFSLPAALLETAAELQQCECRSPVNTRLMPYRQLPAGMLPAQMLSAAVLPVQIALCYPYRIPHRTGV
jgi:hypothetical protein